MGRCATIGGEIRHRSQPRAQAPTHGRNERPEERTIAAIGLLELDLMIPEAHSLKQKRSVLNSLRDRVLNQVNASIAEVGHQDKHARSHLAIVSVAAERETVEKRFKTIQDMMDTLPGAVVLAREEQWL